MSDKHTWEVGHRVRRTADDVTSVAAGTVGVVVKAHYQGDTECVHVKWADGREFGYGQMNFYQLEEVAR